MTPIFGGENFLKIGGSRLLRYPMVENFRQNRSISHGYGVTNSFVFYLLRKLLMLNQSSITRLTLNLSLPKFNVHRSLYEEGIC